MQGTKSHCRGQKESLRAAFRPLLQFNEEKNYNKANRSALLAEGGDDRSALDKANVANAVWVGVRWIDGKESHGGECVDVSVLFESNNQTEGENRR